MKTSLPIKTFSCLALAASLTATFLVAPALLAEPRRADTGKLVLLRKSSLARGKVAAVLRAEGPETFREGPRTNVSFRKYFTPAVSLSRVPASQVPTPLGLSVARVSGAGFDGLTHLDQRLAGNGNQFSKEPPDQGLGVGGTTECNGGPCVLEAVNNAIKLYDTAGHVIAGASTHEFFGLAPEVIYPSGPYGPFTSDVKVYFDWQTSRWFVTQLEIDVNPSIYYDLPHSSVIIAVSSTSNPLDPFYVYAIDTTDDGTNGTPVHPSCPCLGDQPLIAADANAFFISTNEFGLFEFGVNGAQIYAISKKGLESGGPATFQHISAGPLEEGIAYSVQPAVVPPGGTYDTSHGGTEWFLSALDFFDTLDNRIAVWAATNTSSLDTPSPAVSLQKFVVHAAIIYGFPPSAQQPNIPVSEICDEALFMALGCGLLDGSLYGIRYNVHVPLVLANTDRMQQVTYADGKLWGTVMTAAQVQGGPTRPAAAWFAFTPGFDGAGKVTGSYAGGGYVAVANSSILSPSLSVNASGKGAIGFSLVGLGDFPSTGYGKVDLASGVTSVKLTSVGAFPDDGFTGYPFFGEPHAGRWGDYSAASIGPDGDVWMANEYIPAADRSLFANWGTFIAHVTP